MTRVVARLAFPPERPTLPVMEAAGQPERPRSGDRAGSYSGRLLLRMPEELHAELSRASERKGVSLNAFITGTLASAVGLRNDALPAPPAGRAKRAPAAAPAPRRRSLELLLVVNVVVVAVVGILAIVLLVHTLT